MNRNLIKALLLVGVLGSLAKSATAQTNPLPFPLPTAMNQDWVIYCWNPMVTKDPYSTNYGVEYQYDSLFGAIQGVGGTVTFDTCFPSVVTLPVAGRLGFYVGLDTNPTLPNGQPNPNYLTGGSIQDNQTGLPVDDGLSLTWGGYSGVSGNFSIAKMFVGSTTATTTTSAYFGSAAIDTAYWGASDRYFICESTMLNFRIQCRVDVIGDAARVQWTMTNTQATVAPTIGMWFGQWVYMYGPQGQHSADYVTAPGLKPLNVDTRFVHNANLSANDPPELEMPPYLDYGMYQSWAYGLQIVLQPSAQIPDQTACSGIDVGKNTFLLGSMTASDGAMPDVILPDTFFDLGGSDAYVQKWANTPVGEAGSGTETRTIVAYYRSTWSTSDYAKPYSAVLDAPPVVATTPGQPNTFENAPFFIGVDLDDTRGFSQDDQSVPLQDVQITLNLPPGMTDANNPSSNQMVQYLSEVPPQTVAHVVFQVAVDPTLYGNQQYTVTIVPNPGTTKTLTGTVVVASQPYLQLSGTANLVTAPWQFVSGSDWNTIFSGAGLVLDQDYQVFGWDALQQSYVLQTDPQRGFGSFVVTNQNFGFVQLGGNPQQVSDLQSGAPQIIIQPGWNLIANPYNYAIPVGQLVGVPEADNQNSYTFTQLVNLNYINGFLAYWDPLTQGYGYTTTFSDLIQPNTGYWIYVQSNQPVVIVWPPVFQAFIPNLVDTGVAPKKHLNTASSMGSPVWNLQLAARSNGMIDAKTSIGQTATSQLATTLTRYKPPVAPVKNAISSSIVVVNGKKTMHLAQALTSQTSINQTWNWQVFTQNSGVVTLTWPNLSTVPSNVKIKLVDVETGAQKQLSQTSSYSFEGGAQSIRSFQLVVTVGPQLPVIESLTAAPSNTLAKISYTLSVNATTTVTITQNGQVIATLVSNRSDSAGTATASWNYLDSANRLVRPGVYQAVVSATPSGGSVSTKSVSITATK